MFVIPWRRRQPLDLEKREPTQNKQKNHTIRVKRKGKKMTKSSTAHTRGRSTLGLLRLTGANSRFKLSTAQRGKEKQETGNKRSNN